MAANAVNSTASIAGDAVPIPTTTEASQSTSAEPQALKFKEPVKAFGPQPG
jgi:hypothetical protein